MTLTVRAISAEQHRAWISTRPSVSFLQLPEWGKVKAGWRPQSIGWFQGSTLVGAGLVLYRPIPKLKSRSLAYLPEGPDIDWLRERLTNVPLRQWLEPLVAHCKAEGAFQIKMGPPVAIRRWQADTVKDVMAHAGEPGVPARIGEIPADWHSSAAATAVDALRAHDWVQEESGGAGFGDVQPRYVFQIDLANRTLDDVFAGFNQLWRRNIRKAEKAGVEVTRGDYDDLAAFHEVYVETAQRDHFTPRSLAYFQRMWTELNGIDPDRLRLYIARHDGHVAAATLLVVVGTHSWYSYGASTTADRDVRPSNALQWRMITEAHEAGCSIYDLRGISDTLDPANHLYGLVQFKVGTGGFAQEYVGEWDRILRPAWARAFKAYQSRR
jgi:lipid II:glycine glycyltransferase (peptidoglycan interpeptide bridge formation enzyme)